MSNIINSSIIKNQALIKNISNIIINDKLTNSYIIEGLTGSGKTLIANYFAKSLLCENFHTEPCCKCINCINFDKGNLTDVKYIYTKKNALSIEEVRNNIITDVIVRPQSLKYKIYIIESDTITTAAQNSLLKTIEQPPDYAIFIFMTNKISNFLPTIISRCTQFKTQYLTGSDVYTYLKNQNLNYSDEHLQSVANFETGSIGQTLDLLENDKFLQQRIDILNILIKANKANTFDCVNLAKETEKYKKDIDMFYNISNYLYRDLFIYKSTKNKNLIKQRDISQEIINASNSFDLAKINKNFDYINYYISIKPMNNSFLLGLETLFLKLSNIK